MSLKDGRCKTITFNGETKTQAAWARSLGIKPDTLWRRLQRMPIKQALTQKLREPAKILNGLTFRELSKKIGISENTLRKRYSCYTIPIDSKLPQGYSKSSGVELILYRKWLGLRARVRNSSHYAHVKIDPKWEDYEKFREEMGKSFFLLSPKKKEIYLDRIDNEKGYSKTNCRWVDAKLSAQNRTSTRWIKFKGRTLTLTDWASKLGMSISGLAYRLDTWPLERALTTPVRKNP